jgi:hypothetical protein
MESRMLTLTGHILLARFWLGNLRVETSDETRGIVVSVIPYFSRIPLAME